MSDYDGMRRANHDDAEPGWAEPDEEPGMWRRMTRDGLQRMSMPWLIGLCAAVLVILTGVVIGKQSLSASGQPGAPVSVTGSPADDPGIEFSPMPDDPSQGPLPAPSTPVATRTAVPLPSKSATPPSASPSPPKTSPTPAAPIVTFTAVGGYGCSSANTGYSSNDRDTTQGWYSSGSGGWNKDGCSGAFDSMPMSGSATTADPTQYADWAFTVGSASKTCDLSAYVPKYSGDAKRSAGNPAHYAIGDSQGSAGKGTFTIDQIASGGKWLSIKTVAVSGGKLWVRVDNRGIDWGASDGYHIGLGQFKVVCHA